MKQTQHNRLVQYLIEHGSITQLEAFNELGIMRLAPRINVLRNLGYKIETKFVSGLNRYGETTRFARYEVADIEQFKEQAEQRAKEKSA